MPCPRRVTTKAPDPGTSGRSRRRRRATSMGASTTRAWAAACTRSVCACPRRVTTKAPDPGTSGRSRRRRRATSMGASTTRAWKSASGPCIRCTARGWVHSDRAPRPASSPSCRLKRCEDAMKSTSLEQLPGRPHLAGKRPLANGRSRMFGARSRSVQRSRGRPPPRFLDTAPCSPAYGLQDIGWTISRARLCPAAFRPDRWVTARRDIVWHGR